jgi:hypothetical protein
VTVTPNSSSLTFLNTAKFTNILSGNDGGSFYIDNPVLDIIMNTVITLTNSKVTSGKGGVFYIIRAKALAIQGSSFTDLTSTKSGSFIYSVSSTLELDISTSTIDCKLTPYEDLVPVLDTT